MIFKLLVTDQKQRIKGFTFEGGSISEVLGDLEKFFQPVLTDKPEGNHKAVLYNIQFENPGEDESALIENLTNPEYQHDIKNWFLRDVASIENGLRDYLDERSIFANMGI